ncbi:leucine-rich repeat domain-containing protein [uncultured Robinsoniella sp.]|uniref:leucine-rich repeat domain-containing protein n=1 Tax=uncultured Robinsoniella sp. TaxID=904190 RepID=UPI00374ECB99
MNHKLKIIITSIILVLVIAMLPVNNTMASNSNVICNDNNGIPDKVLYQIILRKLNKYGFETFTEREAVKIKKLNASNYNNSKKIRSLKGIEKLKNLVSLDVSYNKIHSLSGIEKLYKLSVLDFSFNQVKNIKSIKNLYSLKHLNLDGNKIISLKDIENLTNLESIYAQLNRVKELPNLKKHTNLMDANFKYNKISKKELTKKLPDSWLKNNNWFKSHVKLQNLVKTIDLVKPKSFNGINKNTKKIIGKANKKSTIVLRDSNKKRIQKVKSDNNGNFTLKNLDLKKYVGKTLSLESYVVDQVYDERYTLKVKKFIVRK